MGTITSHVPVIKVLQLVTGSYFDLILPGFNLLSWFSNTNTNINTKANTSAD